VAIPVCAEKLVTEVPTDPEFIVMAFPSTVCVKMLVVTEPVLTVVALPPFGASVDSELAVPKFVSVALLKTLVTEKMPPTDPLLIALATPPLSFVVLKLPPMVPSLNPVAFPLSVNVVTEPPAEPWLVVEALPLVAAKVSMSVPTEPVLVVVALPLFPVVVEIDVVTVPELLVVTFLLRSKLLSLAAVPLFVQVTSVAVVVHMNCADAGDIPAIAKMLTAKSMRTIIRRRTWQ
jgi:hypothetical protein